MVWITSRLAGVWRQVGREQAQQGGLAITVLAHQAQDVAWRHLHVHRAQGESPLAKALDQPRALYPPGLPACCCKRCAVGVVVGAADGGEGGVQQRGALCCRGLGW